MDWEKRQEERLQKEKEANESAKYLKGKIGQKSASIAEEPKSASLAGKSTRNINLDASFGKRMG